MSRLYLEDIPRIPAPASSGSSSRRSTERRTRRRAQTCSAGLVGCTRRFPVHRRWAHPRSARTVVAGPDRARGGRPPRTDGHRGLRLVAMAGEAWRRMLCYGASGGVTAVTLLFCLLYPRATLLAAFLFPVPAWVVGAIIIVSNVFGSATNSPLTGGVAYDVHLVGAALAVGYWYFGWNFGRLPGRDELRRSSARAKGCSRPGRR